MPKTTVLFAASSVFSLLFVAAACGDEGEAAAPEADAGPAKQIATGVTVDHVAIYQGPKVTLFEGGAPLEKRSAPVVPSRPGLLRIHVQSAFTTLAPKDQLRPAAELHLAYPDRPEVVLQDGPRTLATLADGDLGTTFNFDLLAEQVTPGVTYFMTLRDPSGADPTTFRFPAEGAPPMALPVETFAPTLKVRFVPVRYDADGSSRLPALDERAVEAYRKTLFKLYPVSKVELTVRDELTWPGIVAPDGEGWTELLSAVIETREDDRAAADQYYVGVFNPAATEREYCRAGCILGLAPGGVLQNIGTRSAMVVGYTSERSHGTLAQELAHSMGRLHAPCGNPLDIDARYPHDRGSPGVWGYDVVEQRLVDPDRSYDFMSYCTPVWVSDYTFAALYKQMLEVDHAEVTTVGGGGLPSRAARIAAVRAAQSTARPLSRFAPPE